MTINDLPRVIVSIVVLFIVSVSLGGVADNVIQEAIRQTSGATATLLMALAAILGIPTFILTMVKMLGYE